MSYITDFKSSPFDIFTPSATNTSGGLYNGYTGTGLNSIPDYSYDSLLGSRWSTADGRTLALASNAATALVNGVLCQAAAEVTAFEKLAMTVPAATPATVGTYTVLVTNGSTVLNINQFAGGYLVVASGTSLLGQTLKIASHQAAANAATFVVTLEDPIQNTLTASCTVSLVSNPYKNIIINPSTATGTPVGVTLYPVPASTAPTYNGTTGALVTAGTPQYCFIVSSGIVGCLVDSTVTNVGYPIGRSAATAGAIGVATLTTVAQIGIAAQTLTSAQVGPVKIWL